MKKSEMKPYRERLMALRARLRGEVHQLADSALRREGGEHSTMPIHMADLGSDTFEQDFTLTLMESEETTLAAIESALERMDEGSYGECEGCGGKIPKARLEALPYVDLCVKCAGKEQQKPR
jgi:DnaK suppressor protein